jgi:hypothetical protein
MTIGNGTKNTLSTGRTNQSFDLLMTQKLDELDILANTSKDDFDIDIETTGVVPVVGNYICLQENVNYYQGEILVVTPIAGNQYTITMDTPLDFGFTTSGGCALTDPNMNVNGSVTPVTFFISPVNLSSDVIWNVTKIIIRVQSAGAMDDSLFGDLAKLTNGVVIRANNGITKNILNAKANGDIAERTGPIIYSDKAGGGSFSFVQPKVFNGPENNDIIYPLSAANADQFESIVQDDLSTLQIFHIVVSGYFNV